MPEFVERLQAALGIGFRIERELGGGGMSRVFIAEEVALGRRVVVKVLPPDMGAGLNAERFRREIQLAASLQHPHVVPLHAAGRHEELVWYTMPLIEGESLRARLAREGELPVTEAVRILRDVADSLAYAHAHGVVHRDIKPDNVLLSGRHAVVTDFGVAKALSSATGESSLTSIGVALGTPAYMAPEQAAADPHVDHRADIYSFGAMAYEMLSGRPPFAGSPQMVLAAHVTQAPEPVTQRRAAVPPALATLVMKCLEKKAADRPQTASELHQLLESMTTPSGGMTPTAAAAAYASAAGAPVARTAVFTPMRVGIALLATAVVTLAVWRPWSSRKGELPLDPSVVAVLPFRVAGADESLRYLREGMMDLLHAKLTGAGGPRAADVQSVAAAVRSQGGGEADVSSEALVNVARRVGAGLAIQGSLVGQADRFVMNASLLEMPSARVRAQTSVEGSKDSIFSMVNALAQRLLALSAGAEESQLEALTTTNLEALRAYLDGQSAYRRGAFADATRLLERAIGLDSTFVLAHSALIESSGWYSVPTVDMDRVRRLAWQYRDRLHPTDRQFLSIRLGSNYPDATSWTQRIADRERLVQSLPESPLAWYYLGDALFHFGGIGGVADAAVRARRAFSEAATRDSLFASPLEHLARLAMLAGDTAEFERVTRQRVTLDSTSAAALHDRIDLGLASPNAAERRWAEAYVTDSAEVGVAAAWTFQRPSSPEVRRLGDEIVRGIARRAKTADEQGLAAAMRATFASLQGDRRTVRAAIDSMAIMRNQPPRARFEDALMAALVLDADTAGIGERWRTRPQEQPLRPIAALWALRIGDLKAAETLIADQYRVIRTDTARPKEAIAGLRRIAAILDAGLAQARGAPNAGRLLAVADTLSRGWELEVQWSLALAEALERSGDAAAALAALDRDLLQLGEPAPVGLIARLRLEGRLAARLGDRDRAIRAYRTYLLWRTDPDPSLIPQRDSVRAELARLEGGL